MEKFKISLRERRSKLVFLFIILSTLEIACAQVSVPYRNGKFTGRRGNEVITLNYVNDTVCGEYFYYVSEVLKESGFLDNHKATYISEKQYKPLNYQEAESSDGITVEYCRKSQFKDTFEMLMFDSKNALFTKWYTEYFSNGKIKGKVKYEIIKSESEHISKYRLKDSSIWYFENGNLSNLKLRGGEFDTELNFYENGLMHKKITRIFKNDQITFISYDNFRIDGTLENSAAFSFNHNAKEGSEQSYNEKGELIAVKYFKNGAIDKSRSSERNKVLKPH
jgi:antitoxin component YwqK of YwqJK toxin-antitoxin module